ncbi:MAG TPA: hypothetical protein VFI61_01210 [Patescibacteria group bacterium]|nr:hypothetical protein [Patescibacteria group bacterium]
MSWDFEKSLAQELAARAAEEAERLAKKIQSDETISEVIEVNKAIAYSLDLSDEAFHSLASDPENFLKYKELLAAETQQTETHGEAVINSKNDKLNPNHKTQKTSKITGTVFNTTYWDPNFNDVTKAMRKK